MRRPRQIGEILKSIDLIDLLTQQPNKEQEQESINRQNGIMRISQKTLDQINEVPLDEVVAQYIDLKKEGASYVGYSPFEEHRKRKFSVNPSKNLWACWLTDTKGWGAISFLRVVKGYTFQEAVQRIADQFNIIIEYDK